jgi:hypothetical protein
LILYVKDGENNVKQFTKQLSYTILALCQDEVTALRVALHHDVDLQELVTTPLMLNVLTLAYRGTPLHEIALPETLPARRRQIFATYVQRMLNRQRKRTRATPEQTVHWLTYLARQMREHNQTIFYLEQLQPDWLTPQDRHTYAWSAVRLPDTLLGMLVSLSLFIFMATLLYRAFNLNPLLLIVLGVLGGLLGALLRGGALGRASRSREQVPRQGDHNNIRQERAGMHFAHNIPGFHVYLVAKRAGMLPLRCVRFFDEASDCILLQKVGGGYSFIHRLLLDYFVEREMETSS